MCRHGRPRGKAIPLGRLIGGVGSYWRGRPPPNSEITFRTLRSRSRNEQQHAGLSMCPQQHLDRQSMTLYLRARATAVRSTVICTPHRRQSTLSRPDLSVGWLALSIAFSRDGTGDVFCKLRGSVTRRVNTQSSKLMCAEWQETQSGACNLRQNFLSPARSCR